jgi:hypothetical protein
MSAAMLSGGVLDRDLISGTKKQMRDAQGREVFLAEAEALCSKRGCMVLDSPEFMAYCELVRECAEECGRSSDWAALARLHRITAGVFLNGLIPATPCLSQTRAMRECEVWVRVGLGLVKRDMNQWATIRFLSRESKAQLEGRVGLFGTMSSGQVRSSFHPDSNPILSLILTPTLYDH